MKYFPVLVILLTVFTPMMHAQTRLDNVANPLPQPALADHYVRYFGPSLGLQYGITAAQYSPFWKTRHADALFSVSSGLNFSLGIDFIGNKITKPNATHRYFFLSAGLHFSNIRFKGTLRGFSSAPDPDAVTLPGVDGGTATYTRVTQSLTAVEKQRIGIIQVPLGVAFRLAQSRRLAFFINGRVLPGVALFSAGRLNGTATYDALLEEYNWQYLDPKSHNPDDPGFNIFQAGENVPIHRSVNVAISGFVFSAQFSPQLFIDLTDKNPAWTLGLGIDLTYYFGGAPIDFNPGSDDLLKYPNLDEPSLFEHYLNDLALASSGLRISLYHKLIRK